MIITEPRYLTTPSGRFLRTFADALVAAGRPAVWLRPKLTVAWRERDGSVNRVYLHRWHVGIEGAPRITRIAVNHFWFKPSRRTLLLLDFHPAERPWKRDDLHLELTVLDRELAAFGSWLPAWIAGRVNPALAIPEPPLLCRNWHKDWQTTDYAWTATAWDANRAWSQQEEAKNAERRARRQAWLAREAAGATGTTSATAGTVPTAATPADTSATATTSAREAV